MNQINELWDYKIKNWYGENTAIKTVYLMYFILINYVPWSIAKDWKKSVYYKTTDRVIDQYV